MNVEQLREALAGFPAYAEVVRGNNTDPDVVGLFFTQGIEVVELRQDHRNATTPRVVIR